MPRIPFIAVLLMLLGSVASGEPASPAFAKPAAGDAAEGREAAARHYLTVVTPLSMMEEVSLTTFRGLPPVEAHELAKAFILELRMDALETAMVDALAKNFTVAELEALSEFYSSAHGRSAMHKMSRYMADLMPAMQRALAQVRRSQPQPLASPAP
jgi:ATP-dependent DNA ligase